MNLYIRIKDGMPFEHPIIEENFKIVFPNIDTNNLPPDFAKFRRLAVPQLATYEIHDHTTYEWDGNIVTDVHHIRPMTEEEKLQKQNEAKSIWEATGYPSWTFNEETCSFDPPIPYPENGLFYVWDEETLSWIELNDRDSLDT